MAPSRRAVAIACSPATQRHDENLCGRHGAGSRHHHRQRAAELGRGIDHGAVAGEIGLAREHVHHLRASDARQKLHGEADDAGIRHGAQRRVVAVRVHDGDDDGAFLDARKLGALRATHLEHDVGAAQGVGRDGGAGRRVVRVENAGFDPSARLDRDFGAEPDHLLDGFGNRGHPRLARVGFGNDRNLHDSSEG